MSQLSPYGLQVLQLLPKLVKLDNDDVTAQERTENLEAAQKASQPQLSASNVSIAAPQLPAVATQGPLGANPVLEQVHQPAELQAALAPPPQVISNCLAELSDTCCANLVRCCICLQADSSSTSTAGCPVISPPAAPLASITKSSAEPSAPLPRLQPSFRAQENTLAKCSQSAHGSSSSNVLYAVIALLGDLDESSLQIVRAEASAFPLLKWLVLIDFPTISSPSSCRLQFHCMIKSCTCLAD